MNRTQICVPFGSRAAEGRRVRWPRRALSLQPRAVVPARDCRRCL